MHLEQYLQTKVALGGDISIALVANANPDDSTEIFKTLWHEIFSFERQFSRFLPMSELSQFNRAAGQKTSVSPQLRQLLSAAKGIGAATAGLYNPFILPALHRAGYVKSAVPGYENDATADYGERVVASIDQLMIGDNWALIPFNTALDLGGCGKGYLADQLRNVLARFNLHGYLLSLGGDITTCGRDEHDEAWTVYIQNANNLASHHNLAITCPTEPFAVATSGTFRRPGQHSAKTWHHLIDPTTLEPATTDVRLATVVCRTTLKADVLASCAAILGSRRAASFLKAHGAEAMLLQCQNQTKSFDEVFDRTTGNQLFRQLSGAKDHE